jgi:CRISPR-associated endoribonuclease Cas6
LKITFTLEADSEIRLPRYHNHILQGWLYNQISNEKFRAFLHDQGYRYEKRAFRLFTFSRLQGKFSVDRENQEFVFSSPVKLSIASPLDDLLQDVVNTILCGSGSRLGRQKVRIKTVQIDNYPILKQDKRCWKIRTLSPIVVYSTFERMGRKKTHYYGVTEPEFAELLRQNLLKKSKVMMEYGLGDKLELRGDFKIRPLYSPVHKGETAIYYKNFLIKGHMGVFEVECAPDWLKLALDTGLGSKNAQGFGMVEVV